MTNKMIIFNAAAMNGVSEPVNTYQGWKRIGMQVKKGSKALFKTKIRKPCKVKGKADAAEAEGMEPSEADERLILVDACFFGLSQVEKIAEA